MERGGAPRQFPTYRPLGEPRDGANYIKIGRGCGRSRPGLVHEAGIRAEVRLHVPFEVAIERRRIEVVEEAHGNDAAFTPRHSVQPLKSSCFFTALDNTRLSFYGDIIGACFGSRFVSFGVELNSRMMRKPPSPFSFPEKSIEVTTE